MEVSFIETPYTFTIFIDDLPHISIVKKHYKGFTSYKQNDVYYIEWWLNEKRLVYYEDRELWVKILKLLKDNL